ncbi:MAG: translation initiation factor IF-6 [Candidatus Aenigmarchaeota archaeon]|nr:translation initiation factor IF-6 [Candidatus Aenigmarchaeota archaeon]
MMSMKISTTDFEGDPNLGLYGFATDKYAFLGMKKSLPVLKTKIIVQPMGQTRFSGIFATGNSHGIIISSFFKEYDEYIDIPVLVLKTDFTAIGNLVLINDNGIIISPLIKNHAKEISDFFGLECKATTIAETGVVGSCAIATNKGCVINPFVKKQEMKIIQSVLKVPCDIGTANFSSPYVGSCVIANSNGMIISSFTSGPESGRLAETLGFL